MALSYDQFLTRGLDGTSLWDTIKHKCATHHDMLDEMRNRQKQLSMYSKAPKDKVNSEGVDRIQTAMLRDILFLETMAWRVYMFGSRSLFSPLPGRDGEYLKRMRTDPAYWKLRTECVAKYGVKKGTEKAQKWIKRAIRASWEKDILRRYKY